jgi:pyruvate formate lyase activating enzyme
MAWVDESSGEKMTGVAGLSSPYVKCALLQEPVEDGVRCLTCERRCELMEGTTGWCRTRANLEGVLYTLTYGAVSSVSANPIEKKPLFHFYPGSRALTAGSWSCNFGCAWCQNWDISRAEPPGRGPVVSPEEFVRATLERDCQGTSISLNEPTLSLEWSLEVFRLARARSLYNTYVTNGYMTEAALALLVEVGLDAMNVDLKGDATVLRRWGEGVEVEQVWSRCRQARKLGLHLETTTLVIPGVNEREEILRGIAERVAADLGPETPWHLGGYHPAYHFEAPPTAVASLERAWEIGRRAGLAHVYLGNVPGHPLENTYCPRCGELLLERLGLSVVRHRLVEDRCARCHRSIAGVGWDWAGP